MSDLRQAGVRTTADGNVGPIDSLVVPRFAGIRTFARLPTVDEVPRADVAVLGAPFDGTTTFRPGARWGPAAIREASLLLRPYSEPHGFSPFEACQVVDAGDAPAGCIDVRQAHDAIYSSAAQLHAAGVRVIGLGGDHSVSLPLLRAASERHGTLSLLHFDSHTDTWDDFYGSRVTHGTVFKRALEDGLIDPHASVQIGLRGSVYAADDYPTNREHGFAMVLAREVDEIGVDGIVDIMRSRLTRPVYITLDVDALDPAFAPGTGTPEIGGLLPRELLRLLRAVPSFERDIVSADLVEVAPPYDPAGVTATIGANLAYELVALVALALRNADR